MITVTTPAVFPLEKDSHPLLGYLILDLRLAMRMWTVKGVDLLQMLLVRFSIVIIIPSTPLCAAGNHLTRDLHLSLCSNHGATLDVPVALVAFKSRIGLFLHDQLLSPTCQVAKDAVKLRRY